MFNELARAALADAKAEAGQIVVIKDLVGLARSSLILLTVVLVRVIAPSVFFTQALIELHGPSICRRVTLSLSDAGFRPTTAPRVRRSWAIFRHRHLQRSCYRNSTEKDVAWARSIFALPLPRVTVLLRRVPTKTECFRVSSTGKWYKKKAEPNRRPRVFSSSGIRSARYENDYTGRGAGPLRSHPIVSTEPAKLWPEPATGHRQLWSASNRLSAARSKPVRPPCICISAALAISGIPPSAAQVLLSVDRRGGLA